MKKLLYALCGLVLCTETMRSQQLSGSSLVLTGPQNSQEIGGVGTGGDSTCPVLSSLAGGQYAMCYLQVDGALELGYPNGAYSPLVRQTDLQAAEASSSAQIAALANQISTLQTQVNSLIASTSTTTGSSAATVLDVVMGYTYILSGSFQPVPVSTVNVDTASGFNTANSAYVIPSSGYYLVISKMRLADGTPAGFNYGLSAGTQLIDNSSFTWSSTGAYRSSSVNTSVTHYNQGDQVRLYTYLDYQTLLPVLRAELTIVKIGN